MEYIGNKEFLQILCSLCNVEQIPITDGIDGFINGKYSLKNDRLLNMEFLYELKKEWKDHIVDEFNQYCFSYYPIDKNKEREKYRELEEKYCYRCKYFYEGVICGFSISAGPNETFEEIKLKRKDVCELDKNYKL